MMNWISLIFLLNFSSRSRVDPMHAKRRRKQLSIQRTMLLPRIKVECACLASEQVKVVVAELSEWSCGHVDIPFAQVGKSWWWRELCVCVCVCVCVCE